MKSLDQVGITFVNNVLGRGVLNNVVNIQFGVLPWDVVQTEDGNLSISQEPVVACRLRMDFACAVQLCDVLTELIKSVAPPVTTDLIKDGRQSTEALN
jgi:hypothetical protein